MYSRRSVSRPDRLRFANSSLTLTQDDALSVLEYWQACAERLMLVYRSAEEGITRIGHGRVRDATARELRIDADGESLRVRMHAAGFEFGTLASRAATWMRETPADGLLIRLKADHWMFLRSAPARPASRRREPGPALHSESPESHRRVHLSCRANVGKAP